MTLARRGGGLAAIAVATAIVACGAAEVAPPAAPIRRVPHAATSASAHAPRAAATLFPAALRLIATDAIGDVEPAVPSPQDWIHAIPSQPVRGTPGAWVWATFPVGDEVRVEPSKLLALEGATASLEADDHSVHAKVPGALLVPLAPSDVRIGDVVTAFDWRRDLSVAVVTRRDPYMRLHVRFRDSLHVVREEPIHFAAPVPSEVAPLAWVAFPWPGTDVEPRPVFRGLVFAADAARVLVRDDANRAWAVPRADAKPLSFSTKKRAVGDTVAAYEYGTGFKKGTIQKVLEPGFAYSIKRDGEDDAKAFYFNDVVDAL